MNKQFNCISQWKCGFLVILVHLRGKVVWKKQNKKISKFLLNTNRPYGKKQLRIFTLGVSFVDFHKCF
uniref:Uncharacterized protein n=1 Tax=Anguilla anguilla TaxID=7936 RepID=A0A0E9WKU9_ANGAN